MAYTKAGKIDVDKVCTAQTSKNFKIIVKLQHCNTCPSRNLHSLLQLQDSARVQDRMQRMHYLVFSGMFMSIGSVTFTAPSCTRSVDRTPSKASTWANAPM